MLMSKQKRVLMRENKGYFSLSFFKEANNRTKDPFIQD